ncbi:FMN-dependent NADH-azoreductase [Zobellella aerophila]|uniref:FMN dependent NADH:quinone oxidoreductase n=1 Tax=Zobellella aerophila TaxID=870480 RepID=A0ABP6WB63_9GAMM
MKTLIVTASIMGEQGCSTHLAGRVKHHLINHGVNPLFTERDLVKDNLPHLTAPEFSSWWQEGADKELLPSQCDSDALLEELQAHDLIVLAIPTYNFGMPSQFKAWFDRILRPGISFRYTSGRPEGLLSNKPVLVLITRGGLLSDTAPDHQTSYITTLLAFIGLTDIRFIYAGGLNMGDKVKTRALAEADSQIAGYVRRIAGRDSHD